MTELQQCEARLREVGDTYAWLLDSTETYIPVSVIARELHTRFETVDQWAEQGKIPYVFTDPITGKKRIPRNGLIIFFGRQVMPSFQVA